MVIKLLGLSLAVVMSILALLMIPRVPLGILSSEPTSLPLSTVWAQLLSSLFMPSRNTARFVALILCPMNETLTVEVLSMGMARCGRVSLRRVVCKNVTQLVMINIVCRGAGKN